MQARTSEPSLPSTTQSTVLWQQYPAHPHLLLTSQTPSLIRRACNRSQQRSLDVTDHDIPDESVDLDCVHIVQLLQSFLNLSLICLDIHNKDQGVVLFDLLHRTLSIERVDDHLMGIESWYMGNRFSWVFGRSRQDKGLWSVKCGGEANFSGFFAVHLEAFLAT